MKEPLKLMFLFVGDVWKKQLLEIKFQNIVVTVVPNLSMVALYYLNKIAPDSD